MREFLAACYEYLGTIVVLALVLCAVVEHIARAIREKP